MAAISPRPRTSCDAGAVLLPGCSFSAILPLDGGKTDSRSQGRVFPHAARASGSSFRLGISLAECGRRSRESMIPVTATLSFH